ncbi:hypothetical protein HYPSUDRAFT_197931 [Hypholoma sublateritium FD-334 SS-4]|uniref:Uncharacterized protein n=1 Tax=Hypholoma sublateritium (strain FD-334 SS-4) TaxID=945553 RepID=A0A0D2PGZ8_HYPSF|nr:hypothetical protein HYPSUDRAFT_197931 [Hypholoma sublateritium FD-334 SS-4]
MSLQDHIATLEALQTQLGVVRQVPPTLLQKGSDGAERGAVRAIGEAVLSEPVQAALARARESLETDGPGAQRVNRKRRRAGTPEEYVDARAAAPARRPEDAVPLAELGAWGTAWNAAHATAALRIRGRVVRIALADVLTAYLGIGVAADGAVVVETVRVFGAREAGLGESAFGVFRAVSQQLGRGLAGGAGLAAVAGHVVAYGDLFEGPCTVCGRVVAAEGHVPCVVRRWDGAGWRAEHAGCGR